MRINQLQKVAEFKFAKRLKILTDIEKEENNYEQ